MKSKLNSNHKTQIQKLFIKVSKWCETVGVSAFFNWSDAQIDYALENYLFYFEETSNVTAFICYQQMSDQVEILALGVDPDFQNKGVMGRLLQSFLHEAQSEGLDVFLEVHEQNENAVKLYNKCGFQLLNQRKSYYKDGGSALVFKNAVGSGPL